jgi:uncharacterized protein YeaO (DUF488 family)
MTYAQWKSEVEREGYTVEQVLFDVPPSQKLLEFFDRAGQERWERYALRYERERSEPDRGTGACPS